MGEDDTDQAGSEPALPSDTPPAGTGWMDEVRNQLLEQIASGEAVASAEARVRAQAAVAHAHELRAHADELIAEAARLRAHAALLRERANDVVAGGKAARTRTDARYARRDPSEADDPLD